MENIIEYHKTETLVWTSSKNFKYNTSETVNIIINRDKQCPLRSLTFDTMHSLYPSISIIEVDTLDLMLTLIYSSDCIALLPQKSVEEDLRLAILEHLPPLSLDVFLYMHKNLDMTVVTDCFIKEFSFNKIS